MRHQPIVGDGIDDALDFSGKEFFLRLVIELGVGMLD